MKMPRLYAIVDRGTLDARGVDVGDFARELRDGGVRLLQYRDKQNGDEEILRAAGEIAAAFAGVEATLILNDRADLAAVLGWGVHVGQEDLSVAEARRLVGPGRVVGVSTHSAGEWTGFADGGVDGPDYVAVGPVFATGTKLDASPVIGLEGVRAARAAVARPLVAIGGITLANAGSVLAAGADSVAVISGLMVEGRSVAQVVRNF